MASFLGVSVSSVIKFKKQGMPMSYVQAKLWRKTKKALLNRSNPIFFIENFADFSCMLYTELSHQRVQNWTRVAAVL